MRTLFMRLMRALFIVHEIHEVGYDRRMAPIVLTLPGPQTSHHWRACALRARFVSFLRMVTVGSVHFAHHTRSGSNMTAGQSGDYERRHRNGPEEGSRSRCIVCPQHSLLPVDVHRKARFST